MLLSLVAVCKSYFELLSQAVLLLLGLATRAVMGFTPTIYVSQERTYLFLYMALGISAVYLVSNHLRGLQEKKAVWEALEVTGALAVIVGVILDLVEIGAG